MIVSSKNDFLRKWTLPSDNNPEDLQPIKGQSLQIDYCRHFHFPQTKAKDHLASLGMTSDQYFESPNHCWHSRPGLPPQISSYPNSSRCWVDIAGDRTRDRCMRGSDTISALRWLTIVFLRNLYWYYDLRKVLTKV